MVLRNHIITRLLKDDSLAYEMLLQMHHAESKKKVSDLTEQEIDKMASFYNLVGGADQGSLFYVTNTVIDKLDMLKVEKSANGVFNWIIFKDVKPGKRTFIFDDNRVLRMWKDVSGKIVFCMIGYEQEEEVKLVWDVFFIDENNRHSSNYDDARIQAIDVFVYKLMCFIFLSENEELIIKPGFKHGTKKAGKIINTLNLPIIIVNSRWNVTVIRNEEFGVSGHFRLQPIGTGRKEAKMIFIQPFKKSGYIRRAKSGA